MCVVCTSASFTMFYVDLRAKGHKLTTASLPGDDPPEERLMFNQPALLPSCEDVKDYGKKLFVLGKSTIDGYFQ